MTNEKTESIRLKTADGISLAATFYPRSDSKRLAIYAHGFPGTAGDMGFCDLLRHRGFNALFPLVRGEGESDGSYEFAKIPLDYEAALDWADAEGLESVALVGHSMGGVYCTYLAATDGRVKALVSLAAPATLAHLWEDKVHVQTLSQLIEEATHHLRADPTVLQTTMPAFNKDVNAKKFFNRAVVRVPVLLVHGTNDDIVPFEHAKQLEDEASGHTHLETFYPETDHLFKGKKAEVVEKIVSFLERKLS